jgi:hypothetical protein
MKREVAKGKITPLQLVKMEISENEYKNISSYEQWIQVLNWLLRLSEFKTGEATVINNVYMNPTREKSDFVRAKLSFEKKRIAYKVEMLTDKIAPAFDGDVRMETAQCYFSMPEEWLQRSRMEYKGIETYGFLLSNVYIRDLFTTCMSMRVEYALEHSEVNEADPIDKRLMAFDGIREVLFNCLLLDDVELVDGFLVAKLYTIYVTE